MDLKRLSLLTPGVQLAGVLLIAGAVTACGQPTAAAPSGPAIEIGGTDSMKFDPETITVRAGEAVTIAFKNKGVIVHDYISSGATTNVKLANVLGGREARGVFQANNPGTYLILCVQPGHREAGMVGKIVVN